MTRWPDHRVRVAETIGLGREMMNMFGHQSVIADLSCGDAVIPRDLIGYSTMPAKRVILGDIAPGYELCGPIEQTLDQITFAGLFVCTETIEHLDDPDAVLRKIRGRAGMLLLSTPLGETAARNPEHYWGWDEQGVEEMLQAAGWTTLLCRVGDYVRRRVSRGTRPPISCGGADEHCPGHRRRRLRGPALHQVPARAGLGGLNAIDVRGGPADRHRGRAGVLPRGASPARLSTWCCTRPRWSAAAR